MDALLAVASKWFDQNSKALSASLDRTVPRLIPFWVIGLTTLVAVKLVAAEAFIGRWYDVAAIALPFLMATLAPVAGFRVASAAFPVGTLTAQPAIRICRYGRWRDLDPIAARQDAAFGPTGVMASLIAGVVLNVPFRTMEFMLSMPALPLNAPGWASTIMTMMTLDLVSMNFLYMVCFVLAMRAVPWFPRVLVLAWMMDICLQLAIARQVAAQPMLPHAVADALSGLLYGNIQKALISMALWLPYLILSRRVNVTYRLRVRG